VSADIFAFSAWELIYFLVTSLACRFHFLNSFETFLVFFFSVWKTPVYKWIWTCISVFRKVLNFLVYFTDFLIFKELLVKKPIL
jgi:hypothetical protein